MRKILIDFKCRSCGCITEKLTDDEAEVTLCHECYSIADRVVSAPTLKISGTDPGFPTAWNSWEKKRNQKLKQELKQES